MPAVWPSASVFIFRASVSFSVKWAQGGPEGPGSTQNSNGLSVWHSLSTCWNLDLSRLGVYGGGQGQVQAFALWQPLLLPQG